MLRNGVGYAGLATKVSRRVASMVEIREKLKHILARRDHISTLARFRLSLFGVHSMKSVAFVRRINPDGSQVSSCPQCMNVVAAGAAEIVLEAAEHLHICNFSDLNDW